jgi:hypothetical protein
MLSGLQCLWKMQQQYRYSHSLRAYTPRQFHHLLAHAHRLGNQEASKCYVQLRQH